MKTCEKDAVVIRVWKGIDGDVVALFPEDTADDCGHCTSYQHVGQHAAASYGLCIAHSRPATIAEAEPLLHELRSIGYQPRVVKRASRRRRRFGYINRLRNRLQTIILRQP